jgi:hypothetical protein
MSERMSITSKQASEACIDTALGVAALRSVSASSWLASTFFFPFLPGTVVLFFFAGWRFLLFPSYLMMMIGLMI